jgi:translation initiation factor 5B
MKRTGDGIADLLMLLVQLSQKFLSKKIKRMQEVQCSVLDVKMVGGLGSCADVILVNGSLSVGDEIVMCSMNGPICSKIRTLVTPLPKTPMGHSKTAFLSHQQVHGTIGVRLLTRHDLSAVTPGINTLTIPH